VAGIDTGMSGGISLIDLEGNLKECIKMPVKKLDTGRKTPKGNPKYKSELIILRILLFLKKADFILIEKPGVRPGEGAMQSFNNGYWFGYLLGQMETVLGREKIEVVFPTKWGNYFKKIHGMGRGKDASIEIAQKLSGADFIPEKARTPHDGMAESYLIARYGLEILKNK